MKDEMLIPPALRDHNRLGISEEGPVNPSSGYDTSTYLASGFVSQFEAGEFHKNLKVKINYLDETKIVFEAYPMETPIANALRRVMLSEVSSVAIEKCHIYMNTGVIHDEILAHRLGLIPIRFDPNLMGFITEEDDLVSDESKHIPDYDDLNWIRFDLHVKCPPRQPNDVNFEIMSSMLKWVPLSEDQRVKFAGNEPTMVHPDILITEIRGGQEIEIECYARAGIGQVHAKWSPVATASYTLKPDIIIKKDVSPEEAAQLAVICPRGVFELNEGVSELQSEYRKFPSSCGSCVYCKDREKVSKKVDLGRLKDHFIFTVESAGQLTPEQIVIRALTVLKSKCVRTKTSLMNLDI